MINLNKKYVLTNGDTELEVFCIHLVEGDDINYLEVVTLNPAFGKNLCITRVDFEGRYLSTPYSTPNEYIRLVEVNK